MLLRKLTLFISSILAAEIAYASFDIFPEFHSLTEGEQAGFDDTVRIDSEYQSDIVTYLLPPEWDQKFHASPMAFDVTVGSLSGQQFMQQSRLKLKKPLNESLEFRLTAFQQRDLEVDQEHLVMELVQALSPKFAVSAYGEPSLFKRENDFGGAILFRPSETNEIRVFHTWVDLTRNEHNNQPDRFEQSPRSLGIVQRCTGCLGSPDDWLESYARWETPTRWLLPQANTEYRYERWSIGTKTRVPFGEGGAFNLSAQLARKNEETFELTQNLVQGLNRQSLEVLASTDLMGDFIIPGSSIEPGLGWFQREWDAADGRNLLHRNLVPFVWLKVPTISRGEYGRDLASIGYEVTFFKGDGAPSLAAENSKQNPSEHRLNFRYSFAFRDSAQLALALTADLDAAANGQGGLFEGGNSQFRVFF